MITFNLGLISTYRKELMGLSALGIIACHAAPNGVILPAPFNQIAGCGQLGVIIFFFLSGLGIFYSLSSSNMGGGKWIFNRYKRILIPYSLLALPFFTYATIINGRTISDFILDYSTIGFWVTPRKGVWFIAMLLPMYLISPLVYLLDKRLNNQYFRTILYALLISAMIMTSVLWKPHSGDFAQALFFFVGMWIAPFVKSGKIINGMLLAFMAIALFFVMSIVPLLNEIPRLWTLLPVVMILACWIFDVMALKAIPLVISICGLMGVISLESYLTNVFLGGIFANFDHMFGKFAYGAHYKYLCVIILGIFLSVIVHRLSEKILKSDRPKISIGSSSN